MAMAVIASLRRPRFVPALAGALVCALGWARPARAVDAATVVRDTPGVLGYWPLDERSGTQAGDVLGGLAGTITGSPALGAPTARSDDRGAAINLSGTSAVSFDTGADLSGDVSIEAWVATQPGASGTRYVVSKGTTSAGVHLLVDSANRAVFRVGATAATTAPLTSGTWHQLLVTRAGRTATVYVDGRAAASASLPASPAAASALGLYLGRYSGSASGYWRGRLDEVSLYGRALGAGEVAQHYATVADVTPPTVALTAAPAALVNADGATVAFSASKSQTTFACRLDAGPWTACGPAASYAGLAEGPHTVSVLATDRYGIVARSAATATWQVDRTPPETLLLASAPVGGVTRASFSSEAGAGFECRQGTGPWTAWASPLSASKDMAIAVRARDRAGNVDPTPATVAFAASAGAGGQPYAGAPASFLVAGSQSGASLECQVDGGAWTRCPSPLTFDGLGYGGHLLAVRDPRLGEAVSAPSLTWDVALPTPRLIAASFPSLLTFASLRAQRATKAARAPRLLFASNVDGRTTATLSRRGHRIASWSFVLHRGSNTMPFPLAQLRKLRTGRHVIALAPANAAGAGRALTVRFDVVRLRR